MNNEVPKSVGMLAATILSGLLVAIMAYTYSKNPSWLGFILIVFFVGLTIAFTKELIKSIMKP